MSQQQQHPMLPPGLPHFHQLPVPQVQKCRSTTHCAAWPSQELGQGSVLGVTGCSVTPTVWGDTGAEITAERHRFEMQDKRDVLSNLNTVGNGHGVLLEGITDYIKGSTANKNHMGNACVTWPEFSLVHHRCTYRIIVLSIQSLLFLICEPRWKKTHKLWMHQFFSSFKSAML